MKKSTYALITARKNFQPDTIASALACGLLFKKLNKPYGIVCDGITLPEHLNFLPLSQEIKPQLENLQKLIISVALKDNEIDQFSYDIKEDKLNIYISPKHSAFQKDHIQTQFSPFKYDLICVLDSPDLDSLGKIVDDHADFFSQTPMINIDHHPSNENFGQINLVQFNASSTSEILFTLLKSFGMEYFDQDIATCLLAGITSKTKSFTEKFVTPKTFEIAKSLMEMGANRSQIIKNLYRNKTVATLNLWGRLLARLKTDEARKLAWSLLSENDFLESGATEKNLEGVVEEFIKDIPEIEIMVLFYQKGAATQVVVASVHQREDALALLSEHKPQGTKYLTGFLLQNTALVEAEKKIIPEVKRDLEKRISRS